MTQSRGSAETVADAFIESADAGTLDLAAVQAKLDGLADTAEIESVDVSREAVSVRENGAISGEGTVYVAVRYPGAGVMGEELPLRFDGHIDPASGKITFDTIDVDTSRLSSEESAG